MVVEDGGDVQKLAKACSVFSTRSTSNDSALKAGQIPPTHLAATAFVEGSSAGEDLSAAVGMGRLLAMGASPGRKR